jgi:hypothetical protein
MSFWSDIKTFWREHILNPVSRSGQNRWSVFLVLSGLIYLGWTLVFPLHTYYRVIPPIDYTKRTNYSGVGFVAYLIAALVLFALYIGALRAITRTKQGQISFETIFWGGVSIAVILVFSYPQTAIDLLVYALRTRGWARYGLSPFSAAPEGMPATDPWLGLAGEWADAASPYGPVWEWLSLGTYHLSGGSYLGHLFSLKILALLAYAGSVWLVYRILDLTRPRRALLGSAFFAWNPLVLLESIQNGHNDIVMVFFLLIAVWAFTMLIAGTQKHPAMLLELIFVLGFAAAILVKFIPVVVLPFFLLALAWRQPNWPRRIGVFLTRGLAIALIVILAMLPYWLQMEKWALLHAGKSAGRSLIALLVLALRPYLGTNPAFDYINLFIYLILGIVYLVSLLQLWRELVANRTGVSRATTIFKATLFASMSVFFWYVLLGASTFHAWYLLWFLPLAALLAPRIRTTSAAVVVSLAALLVIPYYETVRVWLPLLLRNQVLGHIIGVSLLLIPSMWAWFRPVDLFSHRFNNQ